ncbi:MAG: hypothetical protein K9J16_14550 [Melioribacteraceae bacterium]|nr:hypothetical protein [Melioribacteraceae bacterium]MCF8356954.1 hypothetical protein [Melioribacteraceae bacterium]MCF8395637.1 hypothetical protein [Melioribacteraceae bacterium]MCF8420644.1 hypothetical protein [Melioribacteraceae bacterium]
MKEICIPIPHFGENQIAEVEVTVNGKKEQFHFRVESFPWKVEAPVELEGEQAIEKKISNLREMIESYDDDWQLVQIFTPKENANYIQVLYRMKTKSNS